MKIMKAWGGKRWLSYLLFPPLVFPPSPLPIIVRLKSKPHRNREKAKHCSRATDRPTAEHTITVQATLVIRGFPDFRPSTRERILTGVLVFLFITTVFTNRQIWSNHQITRETCKSINTYKHTWSYCPRGRLKRRTTRPRGEILV